MNTEQKAREWLEAYDYFLASADEDAASAIITALLAERDAFISLLKDMMKSDSLVGRITDEQILRANIFISEK